MTTLAYIRFRDRGASLAGFCSCKTSISAIHGGHRKRCLSKTCNEESALDVEPRPAGPDARRRFVDLLDKGAGHCLRMSPRDNTRQIPAE